MEKSLVWNWRTLLSELLAEFLGTLFLVIFCTGTALSWNGQPVSNTQCALAAGFAVASIVQALGHISGAHINPIISIAFTIFKGFPWLKAILYIMVQLIGAASASLILKVIIPSPHAAQLGVTLLAPLVDPIRGFLTEFIVSFMMVLTVFGVSDERRKDVKGSAPLAIGVVVASCIYLAGSATGCSMNPARSFGPALVTGIWDNHWVYWVSPICASLAAGSSYQILMLIRPHPVPDNDDSKEEKYRNHIVNSISNRI